MDIYVFTNDISILALIFASHLGMFGKKIKFIRANITIDARSYIRVYNTITKRIPLYLSWCTLRRLEI